jgi:hypothetical protein
MDFLLSFKIKVKNYNYFKCCESESRSWRGGVHHVPDTRLCDKNLYFGFFNQKKTNRHDITELLLKMALNTKITIIQS